MARNLYRFYLYAVCITLLIFAAVGLGRLLQPLLASLPSGPPAVLPLPMLISCRLLSFLRYPGSLPVLSEVCTTGCSVAICRVTPRQAAALSAPFS